MIYRKEVRNNDLCRDIVLGCLSRTVSGVTVREKDRLGSVAIFVMGLGGGVFGSRAK